MGLSPGCVAGVCECQVADPQLVHGAQGSQTAVQGVASLHTYQAGRPVQAEGPSDFCGAQGGGHTHTRGRSNGRRKHVEVMEEKEPDRRCWWQT